MLFLLNILLYSHKRKPTPIQNIKTSFKEGTTTKNINTYILIAIVSLILVVAWAAGKAGLLELDYLSEAEGIMTGDLVVTAGLGGYCPAGLVIGSVREIMTGDDGLAQYAVLEPSADLESLRQVFVIKDFSIVE